MNAAELIYRHELAAEFRRAAQAVALRIRIHNALGQVHKLATLNDTAGPRGNLIGYAILSLLRTVPLTEHIPPCANWRNGSQFISRTIRQAPNGGSITPHNIVTGMSLTTSLDNTGERMFLVLEFDFTKQTPKGKPTIWVPLLARCEQAGITAPNRLSRLLHAVLVSAVTTALSS
jgi:hypothetical protein